MEVIDKFRGFRISSDLVFSVFVDFFCFDWEAFLRGLTVVVVVWWNLVDSLLTFPS